jgi:small nuclear ribonucleoprotein (snRNP)-like protein
MAHDIESLDNVKGLVNELDDGSALILIHVDAKSSELHLQLRQWIKSRTQRTGSLRSIDSATNVYLTESQTEGTWGSVSLVWMQLNGFFELLDLGSWDHVINLSAMDYPLRSSKVMHQWLAEKGDNGRGYLKKSFIQHWFDSKCVNTNSKLKH